MNSKKILLAVFIVVALVQLYVPAKMIWHREDILSTGTDFKFKVAPIDPNDPFRGKYIMIRCDENTFTDSSGQTWEDGESIYVSFTTNSSGFAKIESVSKNKQTGDENFIKAKVRSVSGAGSHHLTIDYPFDRYYMDESKAPEAEVLYRESQQNTNKITFALVSIKNGDAVLKDVMIDGTSIREVVGRNKEESED